MVWVPLEGTQLHYVENTDGNVFRNPADRQYYVLVTGRWFRASALSGPWTSIPGTRLPADFAKIPVTSAKENVLASIPGTPEAQEAAISAGIPQMASVHLAGASFAPIVSGTPQYGPIGETRLTYVLNSRQPIIRVAYNEWYAVQSGVWFTAPALKGPWVVAASLPAVLSSIPSSAPLHYTTFVRVYASTPDVVVVGYSPGYLGVLVESSGLVVYGTGYNYQTQAGPDAWYPAPVTYGYAANLTYTPWTGFTVGFGLGWGATRACYTPAPYWQPLADASQPRAAWGPHGWAAASANLYQTSGDAAGRGTAASYSAWGTKAGTSYNSVTGRPSGHATPGTGSSASDGGADNASAAGASSKPLTTAFGRSAPQRPGGQRTDAGQPGDEYSADRDGTVYRYNPATGQAQKQLPNGTWSEVEKPASGSTADRPATSAKASSSGGVKASVATYEASSQSRAQGDARAASAAEGWGGAGSGSGGTTPFGFGAFRGGGGSGASGH